MPNDNIIVVNGLKNNEIIFVCEDCFKAKANNNQQQEKPRGTVKGKISDALDILS